MYTIKRTAELTGIGLSTLRAWERRYGVVSPSRSEGKYRLYSDADVRALSIMAALVNDGWTASEAAAETLKRTDGGASPAAGTHSPEDASDGAVARGLEDLLTAAHDLDTARVAGILDRALAPADFAQVADHWLMPILSGVGDAWADGRISAAGEHLVSYAVQRRLAGLYEAVPRASAGPVVVLGLPPGARHELGILAFAVAARQAGLATAYLGADLPVDDWALAVSGRHAGGAVVAVPRLADVVPAQQVIDRLTGQAAGVVVTVGGGHQDSVTGALNLGHGLTSGIARLQNGLTRGRARR